MASKVQIWNLALTRCGISKYLSAVSENSAEAIILRSVYEQVVEKVLCDFKWPFAQRYVTLADVGTPPDDWDYKYRYPNDCLSPHRLSDGKREGLTPSDLFWDAPTYLDMHYPFIVVEDGPELAICTDLEGAVLEYTARVDNPLLFPPLFTNCLAWALTAEIIIPLKADVTAGMKAGEQYQLALSGAANLAWREQKEMPQQDSEFVAGRR